MAAKFLPYLLAGISVGGQYALIAIGYTMVYGILRLINFAHGDIFTVAGFLMGVRYCFPSADHFHPAGGGGNGAAGHRSGKDRLQAPAHCAAHVGNDLRDRYVLPFAELDVVCHRRSGQAVPCPAVDQRHRHGAGLPDQAGDGGNAVPRHCAGGSTCYPDPEDQDRHGHARRFPRF